RPGETTLALAVAEAGQVGPVGAELLDPPVPPIGHVDPLFAVDGDTPGQIELARPIANRAPGLDEPAVGAGGLDPVGDAVDHQPGTLGVHRQAGRVVELARPVAERAPAVQEVAVPIERLDVLAVLVADVDVAVRRDRDPARPDDLPITLAKGGELPD